MIGVIKRHPVRSYFALAFTISWIGSLIVGGAKLLRGESLNPNDLWLMGLFMVAGPSVAGILMTYLTEGKKGLQDLLSRMTKWQVGVRWYSALLIFPFFVLLVLLTFAKLVSPEFTPTFFAIGILMGLFAGFIEEIGWMGFAFPKMQVKYSILSATLYLGFLHALWHIMASFLGSFAIFGEYWLPYFLGFSLFVIALRVLIVWVYINTRSLLLAQLMHASSTGFLSILVPMTMAPVYWTIFYSVYALVLCAIAALVISRYGKTLVQHSNKESQA